MLLVVVVITGNSFLYLHKSIYFSKRSIIWLVEGTGLCVLATILL
jgi:hypothetical protein